MNILPKKSWHVLNRDNVLRVKRDEAAAKQAEEEKARRAAIAEQEARIEFMRKRARSRQTDDHHDDSKTSSQELDPPLSTQSPSEHINFFSDIKTGLSLEGSINKDHEIEKKNDQEKWEKKVGILTYLVDKEESSSQPWYIKKRPRKEEKISQEDKKAMMDPLHEMKGYVETKRKCLGVSSSSSLSSSSTQVTSPVAVETNQKKHKKKKKRKHEREDEKKRTLEKLRAERRRREEEERLRSEAVLKKHYGVIEKSSEDTDESTGRYNSQYNPHLSRIK